MPLIHSTYQPPFWLRNPYVQSIWPSLFRKIALPDPIRERIATPDDDFLDLDWYKVSATSLVIISHGLEGNSTRSYVKGMVRAFTDAGVSACAWNFRGCSGEMNRQFRLYHSAAWDDLETVIHHAIRQGFSSIGLVGFSLGGNMTLKYLGVQAGQVPKEVRAAMAVSVPLDLTSSAIELDKPKNKLFMIRFLRMLGEKVKAKEQQFPDRISSAGYDQVKTFRAFDDRYTAPIHGFRDAEDYWYRASSLHELHRINRPTLIFSAADDTFLAPPCFPVQQAERSDYLHLEMPAHGGHVGFIQAGPTYAAEDRALGFLLPHLVPLSPS